MSSGYNMKKTIMVDMIDESKPHNPAEKYFEKK